MEFHKLSTQFKKKVFSFSGLEKNDKTDISKLALLNGLIPTNTEINTALSSLSGDKFDLNDDSQKQSIFKLVSFSPK